MERRTFATGKVWWPDVDLMVTSPPCSLQEYAARMDADGNEEGWVHYMVGDLQRIKIYPEKGFQVSLEDLHPCRDGWAG